MDNIHKLKDNSISYIKNLYNIIQNNNTFDIIKLYATIIFYKVMPFIISMSLLGYDNSYINYIRYLITGYLAFNLLITDSILRQSIKIRMNISPPENHKCNKCSSDIVWNLQDIISSLLFMFIGQFAFKYNIYLDIYWRSYIHTLPIYKKNNLCIPKTMQFQYIGIPFGIANYLIEFILSLIFPFEYLIIIMFFITFVIDTLIYNSNLKNYHDNNFTSIFIIITWKISQFITLGYIELKKRSYVHKNKDIITELINTLQHLRSNSYYRIFLWKEFSSLENLISFGKTSVFYREHILSFYESLLSAMYYLEHNTTIKIARKTKLLHITTMLKPFMSSQNKFYIRLFESRKIIEPFLKQILHDLEDSIKNTKSEPIYEDLYNCKKKIEIDTTKIIDSYY
ncbi:MAG: hypothetical protein Gaeavirus3_10 [Gaeavirus sp.]|uniref:Uncharacterized protein n=1 Tax=Gaeavirus sp. TaxID=2487767 RepID=A0A3G4ZYG2_9VIRU|nr:MAG: hypothetical protein Gaeavirus3_10 [Gaeavirus sp.]